VDQLDRIDDVDTLRELLRAQLRESARLKRELQQAHAQLRDKNPSEAKQLALKLEKVERQHEAAMKALFGQSSERRPSSWTKPKKDREPQSGHGPRSQPQLPVEPVHHVLDDADTVQCQLCSNDLAAWKDQFEESEEIDIEVTKLVIKRHQRQKYRCFCGACVVTAPGPRKLFPKARYSINFALHVALQKYCYHMPLARQVKVFSRQGLDVTTATLWDYLFALYGLLEPALGRLEEHILAQPVMGADETKWRLLVSEKRGKSKQWWVWVRRVDNAVHYTLDPRRSGEVALRLLGTYEGTVIVDGYGAYETVSKANPKLELAHCWTHARREVLPFEQDPRAARVLRVIARMYQLESRAKELGLGGNELLRWRQRKTRPLLEALFRWMDRLAISRTYDLSKALLYIIKRRKGLTLFLENERLSPDNNAAERSIRGVVVGRKNHYGSKSERGTRVAALMYSLLESAALAGVNPETYLAKAVEAALNKDTIPLPHELAEPAAS
jgi:transposase